MHLNRTILFFLWSIVAYASTGAVTARIAPHGAPLCSSNWNGGFQISVVNASSITKRAVGNPGPLILTLSHGDLKDQIGRTGYIASNRQFQFDDPPQAGAIYTAGFSVCKNMTLALASDKWYECYSGGFYNLYDRPAASNCSAIYFSVLPTTNNGTVERVTTSTATIGPTAQIPRGPTSVSSSSVLATVTQISDGQIQGPAAVTTQTSTVQIQAPTSAPRRTSLVSQISDGQLQAPTNATIPPFNSAFMAVTPRIEGVLAFFGAFVIMGASSFL